MGTKYSTGIPPNSDKNLAILTNMLVESKQAI